MSSPKQTAAAEFGRRVRALRRERGKSMEKLAWEAGMSYRTLSDIELGNTPSPGLQAILSLAAALDADPGDLVAGLRPDKA